MLKLLFLITVFVFVEFAQAQAVDSVRVAQAPPSFPYHKAALVATVPTAFIGVLGLVLADEQSDLIEEYDKVGLGGAPLDNAIKRRDTYRLVTYSSIGLCIATVIWNVAESDTQRNKKRVQGQPWWMPKEKAVGISARINL